MFKLVRSIFVTTMLFASTSSMAVTVSTQGVFVNGVSESPAGDLTYMNLQPQTGNTALMSALLHGTADGTDGAFRNKLGYSDLNPLFFPDRELTPTGQGSLTLKLGALWFDNGFTLDGTNAESVDLVVDVNIEGQTSQFTFELAMGEEEQRSDENGDYNAFTLTFSSSMAAEPITIDGIDYIFTAAINSFDSNMLEAREGALFNNDVTVVGQLTPVPLPAAAWLFGTGLVGLVGFSRKRA